MLHNQNKLLRLCVDVSALLNNTQNQYCVVTQRPYVKEKDGVETKGTTLTLSVLYDDTDYGTDPKTGEVIESNVYETFDVTILNGETRLPLKKGDIIALKNFDKEHSYCIEYNYILRFKGYEILNGGKKNG